MTRDFWLTDVHLFVETAAHPKILTVTAVARSVRGRERSPTHSSLRRAAPRSSIETSSARDELIDLAEGSSEGLNPGFWTRSAARACRSRRSTTTRPPATFATPRSSTAASRWPRSSATECLGVVKGEHTFLPYRGSVADVTPQEQWDNNTPVIGTLQIPTFIGMLESYGEIPGDVPHYTAPGGLAGYYPPVKGSRPEILFVLYKPFYNTTTRRRHVTLADIAYLPLMRCSQLLTWFVTARASQLACLCVHGPSPTLPGSFNLAAIFF